MTINLWILLLVFFGLLIIPIITIKSVRQAVFIKPWWTIFMKNIYSMLGKSYFKVIIFEVGRGQVGIDAQYNIHFIYQLDSVYSQAGATHYNRDMEDQAKVAIYLNDSINQVAENYVTMPSMEELEEMADDIPTMPLSGGEEVRQVVDLAQQSGQSNSRLDIQMG